jgi:glucose-1-phosphate thymidylyltransferase
MKGLILAAGVGSRLRPVTDSVPKPLLPVANKPCIQYAIELMKGCGVGRIGAVVGHRADLIRDALGNGRRLGVELSYIHQSEPKGLAHAVSCARGFIAGDPFMLVLADTLFDTGLTPMRERFESRRPDCQALVAPVPDPRRYGVAVLDRDRIVHLEEKPAEPRSNLAMAGVYFFGPALWDVLPGLQPSARGELEITDAIAALVAGGGTVLGTVHEGWWLDTGTLDTMLLANRYWVGKQGLRDALVGANANVRGCRLLDHTAVGEQAELTGGEIRNSIVLPGVRAELNGGSIHSSLIGADTTLGPGEQIQGRILG